MKTKLNLPEEMLMSIDYMNTTNGGMSEPNLNIENKEGGYEVTVKAPGIAPDDLQVEVMKDKLMVYHLLPIFTKAEGDESEIRSIRFLAKMKIPADVDLESISARYDEDRHCLRLHLPADEGQSGFRRRVEIERW